MTKINFFIETRLKTIMQVDDMRASLMTARELSPGDLFEFNGEVFLVVVDPYQDSCKSSCIAIEVTTGKVTTIEASVEIRRLNGRIIIED